MQISPALLGEIQFSRYSTPMVQGYPVASDGTEGPLSPVLNSAGDPIDAGEVVDATRITIPVSWVADQANENEYEGLTNEAEVIYEQIRFKPGTLKLTGCSSERHEEPSRALWTIRGMLEFQSDGWPRSINEPGKQTEFPVFQTTSLKT